MTGFQGTQGIARVFSIGSLLVNSTCFPEVKAPETVPEMSEGVSEGMTSIVGTALGASFGLLILIAVIVLTVYFVIKRSKRGANINEFDVAVQPKAITPRPLPEVTPRSKVVPFEII